MLCTQCGAENPADARFCGACGHAASARTPTSVQAPTPALTPRATSLPPAEVTIVDLSAPAPTVAAGLKFGILAATFFMPFIGIGMGLYYWRQRDSADKVAVGKLWFATGVGLIGLYWALSDV